MSPVQVGIVPIREEHNDYAKEIEKKLLRHHIRVEADYTDSNMNNKIKKFKSLKDPYVIVLGDKEKETDTVSINIRGTKKQLHDVSVDKFIEMCDKMMLERSLSLIEEI